MMAELLKLELEGLPRAEQWLGGMEERLRDLRPVWDVAHDMFRMEEDEQFKTQGAYLMGAEWTPLSPEYAARKEQPPAPFGILYKTGELYRAVTDASHSEHVFVSTPEEAIMGADSGEGSTVHYGKYHQPGGKNLPQRVIVKARTEFKRVLFDVVMRWITRGRASKD